MFLHVLHSNSLLHHSMCLLHHSMCLIHHSIRLSLHFVVIARISGLSQRRRDGLDVSVSETACTYWNKVIILL